MRLKIRGRRFNKLTVLAMIRKRKNNRSYWLCKCDCGKKKICCGSLIMSGKVKSCGCIGRNHGMSSSLTYATWDNMKNRCLNKNNKKDWHLYGGRGIKVSRSWMKFKPFLKDMGIKPKGMSLDRINTNGNYSKNNCRWATPEQQANNSRRNRLIKFRGKIKSISQWARQFGITSGALHNRFRRGWSFNDAMATL